MKIILDECIPRKLKYSLPDHECHTVPEAGLAGKKNSALLGLAESAGFEIFVTMDKGLEFQGLHTIPPLTRWSLQRQWRSIPTQASKGGR
jgi:hypothetical protein